MRQSGLLDYLSQLKMEDHATKQYTGRIEQLEGVDFLSFCVDKWKMRGTAAPKSAESQVPDYSLLYKVQGVDILGLVDDLLKKKT